MARAGADYPHAINSLKNYTAYTEAINILEGMIHDKVHNTN